MVLIYLSLLPVKSNYILFLDKNDLNQIILDFKKRYSKLLEQVTIPTINKFFNDVNESLKGHVDDLFESVKIQFEEDLAGDLSKELRTIHITSVNIPPSVSPYGG